MADGPRRQSLESLKNEARRWLKQLRAGDRAARERLERALPAHPQAATLRDVQLALAREHGFDGWKDFAGAIDVRRMEGERSLARYEAAAQALLDAYRTGTPEAMERHYRHTWHRRAWPAMRTYVQLDLGKRPARPGDDVEITIEDARYLVAIEHGFGGWDEVRRFTSSAPSALLETAKPIELMPGNAPEPRRAIGHTRDWDTIVALLASHPSAELHAHGQMTDAAISRVAAAGGGVTGLLLGGSRTMTDEGVTHLARFARLERLDLSGTAITDRALAMLPELPCLRWLSLSGTRITDAGIAHLARCDALEAVNLSWTDTGDGAIRALAGKPHLREFTSGIGLTDAGLALLRELPHFQKWHAREARLSLLGERLLPNHLSLRGTFSDEGMRALRGLNGLFSLDLDDRRLRLTPAGLGPLIQLPNLTVLAVDAQDDWMPAIAAMPKLRALSAQDTAAGDDGFVALARSRSLEYIWGRRCHNLRRRGFEALAQMPALRGLSVSCLNVDDAGVSLLPSFPALRELMPMDIPDEGYRHIAKCDRLESLILMYCRDTTDRATEHIGGMHLRCYFNSYTTITDRTPEILSRMPTLERITFDGCHGLTDAGVGRLARLPHLRELRVSGRGLTAGVLEAFAPGIEVFFG